MKKRVLSLGQCSADEAAISDMLQRHFDADAMQASDFENAWELLRDGPYDLVLVNRILDLNGATGLDFITQIKGDASLRHVPVMLVSNHDDAQAQAVAHGALPGFGKASLGAARTISRLRAVLGTAGPDA